MPSWTPEEYEQWKARHPGCGSFVKVVGALKEVKIKPAKRVRQSSKPLLNALETEWLEQLNKIYPEKHAQITAQAIRVRLGNGIWFKVDFVVFCNPVTAYEVKGPHSFRGGFENLKVAASLYREVQWILVWKANGTWAQQTILP